MSDSFWPHGLQRTGLSFALDYLPEFVQIHVHWVGLFNSFILCHPIFLLPSIFSSIRVFSSESALPILFQSIGTSASASVLPMNIHGWFPLGLTGLISLLSKGLSRVFFCSSKASILWYSALFMIQLSHPNMTTGKTIVLVIWTFVSKVMSLLFIMLSRFVIAFLPRSRCLLILRLWWPSAVILVPKKIKSVTASTFFPYIYHEMMGLDAMIFVFWKLNFKPAFSFSSFTLIMRLFSSSLLSAIRVVSAFLRLLIFLQAILIPACD